MSTSPIATDQFYHVYNRGSHKQTLFKNERDYIRFLFLILHLQAPITFRNLDRQVNYFQKHGKFKITEADVHEITQQRRVDLIAFVIMPNHFHLCVQSHSDTGVSEYLHRIGTAYSMYFNKKYNQSGHVFQGKYKAKIIEDDNSLTRVSTYIHQNPWELKLTHNYSWSSLQDYQENRWGALLQPSLVINRFESFRDYVDEVERTHQNKLLTKELQP
jgi:putative transposase